MNKFEQVSSDGHQMSGRGCPHVPCVEGVGLGVPCTLRFNPSWVMVTWGPPPLNRMTDTCENITFPKLHWWVIKIAAAL